MQECVSALFGSQDTQEIGRNLIDTLQDVRPNIDESVDSESMRAELHLRVRKPPSCGIDSTIMTPLQHQPDISHDLIIDTAFAISLATPASSHLHHLAEKRRIEQNYPI